MRVRQVDGALELQLSGDGAAPDQLVSQGVDKIASDGDVIVLAQASMARVLCGSFQRASGRFRRYQALTSPWSRCGH